jgi:hypothetical protein
MLYDTAVLYEEEEDDDGVDVTAIERKLK